MMDIARYVEDPRVRRTLREHDGLGTEATRAGIIETLVERCYLVRKGKTLRSTRLGSALISSLPEAASRPERTAFWEQRLAAIAEHDDDPVPFLGDLVQDLRQLLGAADVDRLRRALCEARGEDAPAARSARRSGRKAGTTRSRATGRRRRSPG
jgi:DNA topoisomerase-3